MNCKEIVNEEKFIVYECEKDKISKIKSKIKKDIIKYDIKGFEVFNPKKENILFIAVDNCLISSKIKTKRCDFALVKDEEVFLIELKTNVKPKNRNEKLNEGIEQLKGTIEKFKKKFANIKNCDIKECFICFGKQAVVKSNWSNKQKLFSKETKIPLRIKCEKEFN
jgi:hypothetical protein